MSTCGQVPLLSPEAESRHTPPHRHTVTALIRGCDNLCHLWCTLVDAAERCRDYQGLRLHVCLSSRKAEVWHQFLPAAVIKLPRRKHETSLVPLWWDTHARALGLSYFRNLRNTQAGGQLTLASHQHSSTGSRTPQPDIMWW